MHCISVLRKKDFIYSLAITIIAGCIAYFYELTHFSFSIDEERFALEGMQGVTYATNRWGLILFDQLLNLGMIPFITSFIAIFIFSIAICRIAYFIYLPSNIIIFFCITSISFPQFSYQMEFLFQAPYISLAMLLCILSCEYNSCFLFTKRKHYAILSIALLTFSISIYQSFIFVFISLTILHIVACLYIDRSKYIMHEIYSSICISILSCILYLSISALTIGIHVGYTKNFVHWSFNMSNNIDVFKKTLYLLKECISGSNFYGGSLYVLSIPATIALLLKLYSKKRKNILLYLLVICLPCIPFLQMFIFGGFQPARVFLAQGIILSFLLSYVLIEYNIHTFIIKITTIFILFTSSFYITHLFSLDVNQLNRDTVG